MKKGLFLFALGLIGGFFLHAIVFPDVFNNGIFILPQGGVVTQNSLPVPGAKDAMETIITYDGEHFNRTNITVPSTRYLTIRNDSETTRMSLSSSISELSTSRPYAYKEQVRTRMDKQGEYVITDRNNTANRLIVTVK